MRDSLWGCGWCRWMAVCIYMCVCGRGVTTLLLFYFLFIVEQDLGQWEKSLPWLWPCSTINITVTSNHQLHDCLLNRLFRRRSKKTSKRRVIGLCVENSPGTGEFPTQMASNAEIVSIWWHHHIKRHQVHKPNAFKFETPLNHQLV